MKKTFILLLILVLCVGCTRIDNVENLNTIASSVLASDNKVANTTSRGYKYYLPIGVTKIYDKDYNQKFKVGNNYIYLYADIVSYYYKNKLNLNENNTNSYYYYQLNYKGKEGYIKIEDLGSDKYYLKIVYNYTKIESYVERTEINKILTDSMIILDSIEYNDKLIERIINDKSLVNAEKEYKIDKPDDAESKFSEYLSEYVEEEEQVPELPEY